VLIVGDGGLGLAVLAARAAADPGSGRDGGRDGGAVVWVPPIWGDGTGEARASAGAVIADRFGFEFVDADPWRAVPDELERGEASGACLDAMLRRAGWIARRLGCARVAWDACPGSAAGRGGEVIDPRATPDLDAVGATLDRALLVARLVNLDAGAGVIRIDAPLADLTDWQLADLAADLEAPIDRVWWWRGEHPTGASARARWMAALGEVGWAGLVGR